LLSATLRTADEVERLTGPTVPLSSHRYRIEPVERYVAGEIDMHLPEFRGSADVDEIDVLTHLMKHGQPIGCD
jgi:hypothetical protein